MHLITTEEARKKGKLNSPEYEEACRIRFLCALQGCDREKYLDHIASCHGQKSADDLRLKGREYWKWKNRK